VSRILSACGGPCPPHFGLGDAYIDRASQPRGAVVVMDPVTAPRAGYVCLMDDDAATDISCPTCSERMDSGWVAMWNPILGQKIRWQRTKPGHVRMHIPQGARVVLAAPVGGRDARVAMRCPTCATVVVPPDATYD